MGGTGRGGIGYKYSMIFQLKKDVKQSMKTYNHFIGLGNAAT
jgi:hypothetical protein